IRSGANGFFSKNAPIQQLEAAIHDIDKHGFNFDTDLKEVVCEILKSNPGAYDRPDEVMLSAREIEIVELICRQYTSAQTADKLFINVRTVEAHRKRIMEKIGARNVVGVIFFALKNN